MKHVFVVIALLALSMGGILVGTIVPPPEEDTTPSQVLSATPVSAPSEDLVVVARIPRTVAEMAEVVAAQQTLNLREWFIGQALASCQDVTDSVCVDRAWVIANIAVRKLALERMHLRD